MKTKSLQQTPFHVIVNDLTNDPKVVTIDYLLKLIELMSSSGVVLDHISKAFEVLEYLHDNNALVLNQLSDGSYTIKRKNYG